jgi:PAS domain S-box-containing protein
MYVLIAAAFVVILLRRERRRFVLVDLATLVVGLGVVCSAYVVLPFVEATTLPSSVRVTQIGYALGDVLLLAVSARLLLSWRGARAELGLVAAVLLYLVSDGAMNWVLLVTGSYSGGGFGDLGWISSMVVLGAAGLAPSMRRLGDLVPRRDSGLGWRGPVLLCAALLVTPVLVAAPAALDKDGFPWRVAVMAGGVLLALLVVARLALHLLDSRRLSRELAEALEARGRLLDESQARYQSLVENLPAVTYLARLEGSPFSAPLAYVSPQVQGMLGIPAARMLEARDSYGRLLHPGDRRRVLAQAARCAAEERWFCEYRLLTADGRTVWIEDESAVVRGDDGRPLYRQGVMIDITRRKDAEEERDRMELELRLSQKLEAVGQLAAGIAHEVNTPIQFVGDTVVFLRDGVADLLRLVESYREAIAGLGPDVSGMIAAEMGEAEERADVEYLAKRMPHACERAVDGIRRVATLVQAMRAFGHPGGGEAEPASLNDAITNTVEVSRNEWKYVAEVELELGELPPVVCHLGDLNQVFLNLVVNAAHAIEAATPVGKGTIRIRTSVEGDDAVVTLSDTGCGIPKGICERIFDPFFTTKDVGKGTGQGLALARSIVVDKHGGSLTFESVEGVGTTFVVRVPIDGLGRTLRQAA